ncbi:ferric iron uptake transcriptional regulator [Photobacterium damselae subsp. piscicida]|nr:ferric iron uptake transcriptional regulator [Photobacterium damselae subsp. piscicida]MDP2542966.1 ferric iron uptake transcriptional regulator [Photobacterium damselae subsp. piscicida]MDP2559191.1 ferric iron uptake transcriptional regulator [Photobacterium damselae subsp. piscicida]
MSDNNHALKQAGLKITLPRLKILEVLQQPECQHISAEDLYKKLIDIGEEIGLATVYRVLNQFDDAGIVTRHHFEGGKSVFELATQHHHDHLVCLDCGKVIEFSDELIERRQKEIAAQYNVDLTNHSLYLYGHCANGDCCKDESLHNQK